MEDSLYNRYIGHLVQIDLDQRAMKGVSYVGRLTSIDEYAVELRPATRAVGIDLIGSLELAIREVTNFENKKGFPSAILNSQVILSKGVIARLVALSEPKKSK